MAIGAILPLEPCFAPMRFGSGRLLRVEEPLT